MGCLMSWRVQQDPRPATPILYLDRAQVTLRKILVKFIFFRECESLIGSSTQQTRSPQVYGSPHVQLCMRFSIAHAVFNWVCRLQLKAVLHFDYLLICGANPGPEINGPEINSTCSTLRVTNVCCRLICWEHSLDQAQLVLMRLTWP